MASRRWLNVFISLTGLVVFIWLFYRLGPQNILSLVQNIGWGILGVVFIYGIHLLVRAAALSLCLPDDSRPPYRELLQIRFISEAIRGLTLTGPFLSEPAAAWFMKRQGVRSSEAAAAAIAEYVAHSFGSAFLTVVGVLFFRAHFKAIKEVRVAALVLMYGSAGYLILAAFVLSRRVYFISSLVSALGRVPGLHRIAANREAVRKTEDALFFVLRDRPTEFMQLMGLEAVAHALLILENYWAMVSMGLTTTMITAFIAEAMSKLANVLSVAGATEGAYAVVFFALGLPAAAGFTLSLVKRVRSLLIALFGLGSLASLPRARRDSQSLN